jgi:hypothetical protein
MKSMHRLRIGLIGLASVFLLVMLATVFVHIAGGDQPDANSAAAANEAAPSDPLAELGVAPGNPDQGETPAAKPKSHPAAH